MCRRASLRLHAAQVLGNAALRPWAVADGDGYNVRDEVDAGLDEWGRVNGARRRVREAIRKAYPAAERALVRHYERAMGLSSAQALDAGARVPDVVYRAHFVFPRDEEHFPRKPGSGMPWRGKD